MFQTTRSRQLYINSGKVSRTRAPFTTSSPVFESIIITWGKIIVHHSATLPWWRRSRSYSNKWIVLTQVVYNKKRTLNDSEEDGPITEVTKPKLFDLVFAVWQTYSQVEKRRQQLGMKAFEGIFPNVENRCTGRLPIPVFELLVKNLCFVRVAGLDEKGCEYAANDGEIWWIEDAIDNVLCFVCARSHRW